MSCWPASVEPHSTHPLLISQPFLHIHFLFFNSYPHTILYNTIPMLVQWRWLILIRHSLPYYLERLPLLIDWRIHPRALDVVSSYSSRIPSSLVVLSFHILMPFILLLSTFYLKILRLCVLLFCFNRSETSYSNYRFWYCSYIFYIRFFLKNVFIISNLFWWDKCWPFMFSVGSSYLSLHCLLVDYPFWRQVTGSNYSIVFIYFFQ